MNILIFSEAAWDDTNSFGNTVSNFFNGDTWNKDCFSNFYARNQMPNNKSIVNYYQLSAVDIVKGLIKLRISGKKFTTQNYQNLENSMNLAHKDEQKKIDKLHQNKNEFIYWGHELIWRSRIWLNKYFKEFIDENKPDVLFAFATSPFILWPLIRYLKTKTECKIVLLVADDTYGNYNNAVWYRKTYLKRDLKKCILSADKLYGISDKMSRLYQKQFGKECETLYKGCDLTLEPNTKINDPIRLVYAGNLFWGRDDILSKVALAIEKLNHSRIKATLEIYTGATITPEIEHKLNRGSSSKIMGSRSYDEIKKIMYDSDIVIHVESFNEDSIETVKYSLSTKIIDCLQSGSQVVGIGPKDIASIEYLKKVDGAIVIEAENNIEKELQEIIANPELLLSRAKQTREYALKKHEINNVQKKLRKDFESVINMEVIKKN